MPRLASRAVMLGFGVVLAGGQPEDSGLTQRAYELLRKQDLVTLASVFAVLLLLMIIVAVCVYKPLNRR